MNLEMDCEFYNESVHKNKVHGVSTAMQYLSLVWQDLQPTETYKGSDQEHIFPVCRPWQHQNFEVHINVFVHSADPYQWTLSLKQGPGVA